MIIGILYAVCFMLLTSTPSSLFWSAFEDDSQTSRAPISQSTYYLLSNNTYYQESTMSSSPYHAELELAKSAALKAGEIIRKYSGNSGRSNNSAVVCVKSGVDLVTEADTHVERVVTQIIKAAFPEDDIVGEEDQVEFPKGRQDDPFPTGRIWCGKYHSWFFATMLWLP